MGTGVSCKKVEISEPIQREEKPEN